VRAFSLLTPGVNQNNQNFMPLVSGFRDAADTSN